MRKPVLVPVGNSSATSASLNRNASRQMKLSVLYRHRSLPHVERKLYHMVMGLVCFALYGFILNYTQAMIVLCVVGIPFVILDIIRLNSPKLNNLALKWFGKIMRREELKSLSANSYYIMGLMIIGFAFPKPVCLMSILFLAVGDPVAAIIGARYGKRTVIGKKSLEGCVANFVVSTVMVFVLSLVHFGVPLPQTMFLCLAGGFVSVIAEVTPLPLNDNLTIPVISAILLSLIPGVPGL